MNYSHVNDLHQLLSSRRTPLPLNTILTSLEVKKATFHRIRTFMVDCLGAPIKNRKGAGYYYEISNSDIYELPGLWFSIDELMVFSLLEQLLESTQPLVMNRLLAPVRDRIHKLADAQRLSPQDWNQRLRVLPQWQRSCSSDLFSKLAQATLQQKQIEIEYNNHHKNTQTTRHISPQQLVYYRDNWYLDGWCHLREALRTFSIDAIQRVSITPESAFRVPQQQLRNHFENGYGIFSGQPTAIADLQFSAEAACWVNRETWHPDQTKEWMPEGRLRLKVPYSDPRELVRDLMRFGVDVEVLGPDSLREQVKQQLEMALKKYL